MWCQECHSWYPNIKPSDPKNDITPAYHAVDCEIRAWEDWEGVLLKYKFEGDIMYEIQSDGSRIAVSTFSRFPEPYTETGAPEAQGFPELIAKLQVRTWSDFSKQHTGFAKHAERNITKQLAHTSAGTAGTGTITGPTLPATKAEKPESKEPKKPDPSKKFLGPNGWEDFHVGIPRDRYPNAWRFCVKFQYMPDWHKNTRWGGAGYRYYHNSPYAGED